jgi:outer membrane receptor protein involved in Fe transport
LRLVSRGNVDHGASFAWLAGVYALRTDEDVQQHDVYHDFLFGDGDLTRSSEYRATNLAVYSELEWRLTDATVLSAGARIERRSADYSDTAGAAFSPDESMYGGSLELRHLVGERTHTYLKFARGYKAGGFNIGAAVPEDRRTFDTECCLVWVRPPAPAGHTGR